MNDFFSELKRRNVVRVAIAFLVMGWVILQFVDIVSPLLGLPDVFQKGILILLVVLFPIALLLSWAYEVTPEGVKKTKEVDKSKSVTHGTGQKINKLIAAGFVLAVAFIVYDKISEHYQGGGVQEAEAGQASIAVLPFTNLSGLTENAQFTNGLHDDLLTQLSKIESLKVISRTSVLEYRDTTKNMKDIADELGVTTLMEGGIQMAGGRVRINVQLIDAATDEHLWAETYDRELSVSNIFDLQTEIARHITDALKTTFDPAAVGDLPTESLEAYEAYQAGRLAMETTDYSLESLEAVRAHYERAVAIDPNFALAWAEISTVNDNIYWFIDLTDETRAATLVAAEKALELDPDLPEGHFALGQYYYHGLLDYDRALAELAIAEAGMAGMSRFHNVRAAVFRRNGDFEAAATGFKRSVDLNPKDFVVQLDAIFTLIALRRYKEASARTKNFPDTPEFQTMYALMTEFVPYAQTGNPEGMLKIYDQMADEDFGFLLASPDNYFNRLWEVGRYDEALTLVDRNIWAPWRDFESFTPLNLYRGFALYPTDPDAARPYLESGLVDLEARLAAAPNNEQFYSAKAFTLALLGRGEEALVAVRRALESLSLERDAYAGVYQLAAYAQVLVMVGEYDEALDVLERYLSLPAAFTLRQFMAGLPESDFENHPGFAALVEKHGWEHQEAGE